MNIKKMLAAVAAAAVCVTNVYFGTTLTTNAEEITSENLLESTKSVVAEYEIELGYDDEAEITFTPEQDGEYLIRVSGENERFLRTKLRVFDGWSYDYVDETSGCSNSFKISTNLSSDDNYKIVLSSLIEDNYNDDLYNWNESDVETYKLNISKVNLNELSIGKNTIELSYDDMAKFTFTPEEDGEYTFLLKGENERYLSYSFDDNSIYSSIYSRTDDVFCDNVQISSGEECIYTLSSLLTDYNGDSWASENYEYNWSEGDVETYTLKIVKADIREPIEVGVGEYEVELGYNSYAEFIFTPEESGTYIIAAKTDSAKYFSLGSGGTFGCYDESWYDVEADKDYSIMLGTLLEEYYWNHEFLNCNYDWTEGETQTYTLTIYKMPTIGIGEHEVTLGYDSKAQYQFVPEKTGDYYFIIEKGGNNNYLHYMIGSRGGANTNGDDIIVERSYIEGYSYNVSLSTLFDDYYEGYDYGWSEDETYTYTLSIGMIEEVEVAFSELEDYSSELSPNTMKKIRFTPEESGEYQISCGDNFEMWLTTVDENPDYNYTRSVDRGYSYYLMAGTTYELLIKSAEASEESVTASISVTEYSGVESTYAPGDVTRDGYVNLYDAIEVAKYMMNMVEFDDEQLAIGDMDSNGIVNLYDCIEIAIIIMG